MPPVPSPQSLRALRALIRPHLSRPHVEKSLTSSCPCHRLRQHSGPTATNSTVPFRAQLKQEHKTKRNARNQKKIDDDRLANWDLTVGIEIHAELSTSCKLFSSAQATSASTPNNHAALFDTGIPGAQPQLQKEVLLPAIRAALALNCQIQEKSGWDRKHYFWWDQPQGYQITQYYEPFARNGRLVLYPWEEIDAADDFQAPKPLKIGIKQVQLEQDTAKTILQPPDTYLLDFNRAGLPLVEIITRPEIKSAKTAAAVVKKIQALLQNVGASTTGMEMGGLRADVNVSVRRKNERGTAEYDGVKGLGQRTEIKNLSSFKAVEEAIIAERDRQIDVLESGGFIEGETRGWTLGASTTHRLRGKEGEIDYRYMPDPDLEELYIGRDLVEHLEHTLPKAPSDTIKELTALDGHPCLSIKDAKTLVLLDDGERLEYYFDVLHHVRVALKQSQPDALEAMSRAGKAVGNWVLMELPSILTAHDLPFPYCYQPFRADTQPPPLSSSNLAAIIVQVLLQRITQQSARALLNEFAISQEESEKLPVDDRDHDEEDMMAMAEAEIDSVITRLGLWVQQVDENVYQSLAAQIVSANEDMAQKARAELVRSRGKKRGKTMWLVGQMVKNSHGNNHKIQARDAERFVVDALLKEDVP